MQCIVLALSLSRGSRAPQPRLALGGESAPPIASTEQERGLLLDAILANVDAYAEQRALELQAQVPPPLVPTSMQLPLMLTSAVLAAVAARSTLRSRSLATELSAAKELLASGAAPSADSLPIPQAVSRRVLLSALPVAGWSGWQAALTSMELRPPDVTTATPLQSPNKATATPMAAARAGASTPSGAAFGAAGLVGTAAVGGLTARSIQEDRAVVDPAAADRETPVKAHTGSALVAEAPSSPEHSSFLTSAAEPSLELASLKMASASLREELSSATLRAEAARAEVVAFTATAAPTRVGELTESPIELAEAPVDGARLATSMAENRALSIRCERYEAELRVALAEAAAWRTRAESAERRRSERTPDESWRLRLRLAAVARAVQPTITAAALILVACAAYRAHPTGRTLAALSATALRTCNSLTSATYDASLRAIDLARFSCPPPKAWLEMATQPHVAIAASGLAFAVCSRPLVRAVRSVLPAATSALGATPRSSPAAAASGARYLDSTIRASARDAAVAKRRMLRGMEVEKPAPRRTRSAERRTARTSLVPLLRRFVAATLLRPGSRLHALGALARRSVVLRGSLARPLQEAPRSSGVCYLDSTIGASPRDAAAAKSRMLRRLEGRDGWDASGDFALSVLAMDALGSPSSRVLESLSY